MSGLQVLRLRPAREAQAQTQTFPFPGPGWDGLDRGPRSCR